MFAISRTTARSTVCVIHPHDLAKVESAGLRTFTAALGETSIMLEFAPHLVRRDKLERLRKRADKATIEALVFERGDHPGRGGATIPGSPNTA